MKPTFNNAFVLYEKKRKQQAKLQNNQRLLFTTLEKARRHSLEVTAKTKKMRAEAYRVETAAYNNYNRARRICFSQHRGCSKMKSAIATLFPTEYRAWKNMIKGININKI
jgi:hypothetical protein